MLYNILPNSEHIYTNGKYLFFDFRINSYEEKLDKKCVKKMKIVGYSGDYLGKNYLNIKGKGIKIDKFTRIDGKTIIATFKIKNKHRYLIPYNYSYIYDGLYYIGYAYSFILSSNDKIIFDISNGSLLIEQNEETFHSVMHYYANSPKKIKNKTGEYFIDLYNGKIIQDIPYV